MKNFVLFLTALLMSCHVMAQQNHVTGTITDGNDGSPIIGANVLVLNSNPVIGTMTDADGNFKLVVPVGRVTLRFTYIGYEDMVVPELLVISGKKPF